MHARNRLVSLILLLGLAAGISAKEDEAHRLVGRVPVRGDGFVQIAAEDLARLGVRSPERLRVVRHGEAVPICTSAGGKDLVFLALDTAGPNTATAVYEVFAEPGPVPRAPVLDAAALPKPTSAPGLNAVRIDAEDRVFGEVGGGRTSIYKQPTPTWFLHRLDPQGQVRHELDARGAQGAQVIRARVQGTYVGPIAVAARLGRTDLGLAQADNAAGGATLVWRVPPAAVPRGTARLTLTNRSPPLPPAPGNDLSIGRGLLWIDAIELAGPRIAALDERLCVCALADRETLFVRGPDTGNAARRTAALLVLDRDGQAAASIRLPAAGPLGPWLRIDASTLPVKGRLAVCATPRRGKLVAVHARPDPVAQVGRARHVILAVPALLPGARMLADHRTRDGLPSVAVDVMDVYAAFGHGEQTPAAIRAFVKALQARETPLEYLLLAGDAIHDRTDWSSRATIPAPMARTMWNGATPCDRLYVGTEEQPELAQTSVGRLPFRRADTMARYVARLIEQERHPPVDARRRLMRFLAGNAGMGAAVNRLLEYAFRRVLDEMIDPALEIEVTYASPASPFYWPLRSMNDKIVDDINQGCLYYTFVGHGTSHESDIRSAWDFPLGLFTANEVGNVDIRGPRPVLLVLASSSAAYDLPKRSELGEALLARHGGPLAYWGATRFCNPVFNILVAQGLAENVGHATRVGDMLRKAEATIHVKEKNPWRPLVLAIARSRWPDLPSDALLREGILTYTLLGDPALRILLPKHDLTIQATRKGDALDVSVRCTLPPGTPIHVQLVRRRNDTRTEPKPAPRPDDPASAKAVKEVHRRANDRVLARARVALEAGGVRVTLRIPEGRETAGLRVVAFALTPGDVHHGALVLE